MRRNSLLLTPLLAFALVNCTSKSTDQSSDDVVEVPVKINLQDLNGHPVDLDQFKGKTVFLNFWATWCRPCIEEMPSIASAKGKLNEADIIFLFASDEDVSRITSFEKKNNLGLTYVQVTNLEDLNILALPTTYIINPRGEVVFSETGFRKWDDPINLDLITQIINTHD